MFACQRAADFGAGEGGGEKCVVVSFLSVSHELTRIFTNCFLTGFTGLTRFLATDRTDCMDERFATKAGRAGAEGPAFKHRVDS